MHENITLKNVRIGWHDLLEPNQFDDDADHRFRAEVLIEPDSEAAKVLEDAIMSAATDKWESKAEGMLSIAKSNQKICRVNGNDKPVHKKTMELADYYVDHTVLNASRVQERDGDPRTFCKRLSTGKLAEVTKDTKFDDDLLKPTPGFFGDVLVTLWGYEYKGSPQLNCTLEAVAFNRAGDSLRAGKPATTEKIAESFGEIEESPF